MLPINKYMANTVMYLVNYLHIFSFIGALLLMSYLSKIFYENVIFDYNYEKAFICIIEKYVLEIIISMYVSKEHINLCTMI